MEFYDQQGEASLYSPDGQHLYTWRDGNPVAYLHGDKLYDFGGRYLGWFDSGWLFDQHGRRMLFMREASGGPVRPLRKLKPLKGLRKLRPLKALRELSPVRPVRTANWSGYRFW